MENPEEVLQALDEFQKMRPSEIPRELEDYLCWVAKTGDPVYQWSLIKALFREKLVRVMTEFYENCPSLDLTPCPNVEQFNYDIMKRNLLDRLESFANAPFTVQRICELLTSPRKEYSRIDKFMRAIEKNILVVSTREPGPYGRRSENGDSLVNGSLEDETSRHGQACNEVDMENWVKDCSAAAAALDGEKMSVENGLNSSPKSSFDKQERIEHQLSGVDTTSSSFVTTAGDFSVATVMPTQISENLSQDSPTIVQNLASSSRDTPAIVTDVSDAIINEDTSSQPTLELESDDNDSNDSKKLQTTFQTKDFTLDDDKSPKLYSDAVKLGKLEEISDPSELNKEKEQVTQIIYSNESQLIENTDNLHNSEKVDNLDVHSIVNESNEIDKTDNAPTSENNVSSECTDNLTNSVSSVLSSAIKDEGEDNTSGSSDVKNEEKCNPDVKKAEEKTDCADKENITGALDTDNLLKESLAKTEIANFNEVIKPVIEEPILEKNDISTTENLKNIAISIEETLEEEPKASKTMIPDPIPIIEEPKDVETSSKDWDNTESPAEMASESESNTTVVKNGTIEESILKSEQVDDNQMVISEDLPNKAVTESMDIDSEGVMLNAQQDEPMEQETTESMNS